METVHADWGNWLPQAVFEANTDGLALWYLGCNGFFLKAPDGTTVLIDPYLGTGDPPRTVRMIPIPFNPDEVVECDAILATHEHTDHVHGPSQAPILAGTDSNFYGPDASVTKATNQEDWTTNWDVSPDQLHVVTEGDRIDVGSLRVHVEPAYDPDATHPVSYVVEHDSETFFHGGDARPSQEFKQIGERYDIDLGALAFGSSGAIPDKETRVPKHTQWYSGPNMVAEAANQLQLGRLVPTHWDMWKGLTADPRSVRDHCRSFAYPESIDVVEIGDRVAVSSDR
jgi:L-ascorbate 6-phosphate lactonase